jgi:tryptophanyl-tRNA synthetase
MRILSGIQPSGDIHIGNYLGMIRPMIEYQRKGELFCFIANMHSLTSVTDANMLHTYTHKALLDLLALGIDPDTSVFWVQSDVPEVAELTWYLNNVTPVGLLQRCHSYKDKVARNIAPNNGLFSYPVLMAADILLYRSNLVPVGKDQKQHVEVTRDIAIRFNQLYGELFTLPEPEISEAVATVPGIDGNKMSKSYDNTIEIFGAQKNIRKKVMRIVTDSAPVEAPKNPYENTVYKIYRLFADEAQRTTMETRLRQGGYGYGDAKKELYALLMDYFTPYRARREELEKDPGYIQEVRAKGAHKAREIAAPVLDEVRTRVGMV